MRERGGAFGAMAAGHALGPRRRARGVEHDRPGLGIDARLDVRRFPVDERFERKSSPARSPPQCAGRFARLRSSRTAVGGDVLVNDRLRLGVGSAEVELVGGRAPVQRRDDDTGELAGPMDGGRLPAILQHRDEVIARLEAQARRSGDKCGNPLIPLRDSSGARRHRPCAERFGIARDAREKTRAEIKHGPSIRSIDRYR